MPASAGPATQQIAATAPARPVRARRRRGGCEERGRHRSFRAEGWRLTALGGARDHTWEGSGGDLNVMESQCSTRLFTFSSDGRHPPSSAAAWENGAVAGSATPSGVVAVVLAAGAGTRFRGPGHKLDAAVADGRSVLDRAVGAALAAGIGPVVVVTAGQLTTALHPAVVHVVNERWADGQITSLRAGIDAAEALGADAVVVGLGDQPFVSVDAWRAVAARRRADRRRHLRRPARASGAAAPRHVGPAPAPRRRGRPRAARASPRSRH